MIPPTQASHGLQGCSKSVLWLIKGLEDYGCFQGPTQLAQPRRRRSSQGPTTPYRMVACDYRTAQPTLRAAGALARAFAMVPSVVQSYQVCHQWQRPSNKSILTSSLSEHFNDDAQLDLLFYKSLVEPERGRRPIIHRIDTCLRWSATLDVKQRDDKTLLNGIATIWIQIYGAPEGVPLDQETGMRGTAVDHWAIYSQIMMNYQTPIQKAWLVERHNEILRVGLYLVETQVRQESIVFPFTSLLALLTFMRNPLIVINDATPYRALFGRQPAILPPLEGGYHFHPIEHPQNPSHELSRIGLRDVSRVREMVAAAIVEATAQNRLEWGNRHKTHPAQQRSYYESG